MLHALGASHIVEAVFAVDEQMVAHVTRGYVAEDLLVRRLDRALQSVLDAQPIASQLPDAAYPLAA